MIFPEGTCINNTSVMQFKKGSFEVGGVIYPVAIKYDSKFGDAFWNRLEDIHIFREAFKTNIKPTLERFLNYNKMCVQFPVLHSDLHTDDDDILGHSV